MPPTVSNSPPIWWLIGQGVTWLIVLAGWFVVDNQNNRRELRKEIRTLIDNLIKEIDEVAVAATDFHKRTTFDDIGSKQLKLRIQRIAKNINRNSLVQDTKAVYYFRRSITGNNFDVTMFVSQVDDSKILASILEEKDELISALEDKYCNKYHKNI